MQAMPTKEKVRTPKEMAKAAMKLRATDELHASGLDTTARITVDYMGISHVVDGKVTVNVDNGQIMFNFGANTPFELESEGNEITLNGRLQANLFTRQSIENWKEIREKYLGKAVVSVEDEELDRDEVTA